MQFKAPILKFEWDAWSYFLEVQKEIGDTFVEGDDRRVTCAINGAPSTQSALMPKGDTYRIYVKKDFMKKHGILEGDEVSVVMEKDRSEYGIAMPPSFSALLDQDSEGAAYFHALTKGKQRSLLHIVGKVKKIDKQLAKGLAIMHHLKESEGTVDFKRLNEIIKQYNQLEKGL